MHIDEFFDAHPIDQIGCILNIFDSRPYICIYRTRFVKCTIYNPIMVKTIRQNDFFSLNSDCFLETMRGSFITSFIRRKEQEKYLTQYIFENEKYLKTYVDDEHKILSKKDYDIILPIPDQVDPENNPDFIAQYAKAYLELRKHKNDE
jgi:hypothetical protein